MYEKIFEPMRIGTLCLKNRFVMPAMNSHYADAKHHFTEQALNYYGERALGGFGLQITEFLCVSEEGLAYPMQAGIYSDEFIPTLSRLTERIHQNGGRMFAQLHHAGRMQGKGSTKLMAVGASNIPDKANLIPVHELTTEEVGDIIQKFILAAMRAQKAGFDGVEIHGAHGYLLSQFLSKGVNKRVDAYGGNITNRARIVCEIVEGIKAACGQDFPVSVRTSGDEGYRGGNSIEDAAAQCILFEKAGADVINVSHGIAIHSYYSGSGFNIENVRKVKQAVSVPVIGVGRMNDPTLMLSAIETGAMDFVALGRESVCDPHLPEKIKEGRLDEILTCTGCMQRCLYTNSFEDGFGISCMINPFSGKEHVWEIKETEHKKNIGIVGAGPAGLQAAWILAKRGHRVTVYEKEKTAGGQYRLAAVPMMKQELAKTISTYLTFCEKYGAKIQYGVIADREFLQKENCDEIILACGAVPIVPGIEGIEQDNVCLANEILSFKVLLQKKKVMILGAGLVGVETAEILSEYGNDVTVVDMLDAAAPLAPARPRENLLSRLSELHVKFQLNSKVIKILKDGITCEQNGERKELTGYDAIVLAFGSKSDTTLYQELQGMTNVHLIGDARQAGDAKKGIYEATKLALEL
jgi:2,4-dienoyl-CoA reductase-like NADH-dependent reductase (Old Yellow Enzyme family)/thioredoxin reductase